MTIVAGRTKAACRVVFIKSGVHLLDDKGYVRFWHKADITRRAINVRYRGKADMRRTDFDSR
jgi:hypothetical protein